MMFLGKKDGSQKILVQSNTVQSNTLLLDGPVSATVCLVNAANVFLVGAFGTNATAPVCSCNSASKQVHSF
jgi:hypothetical protein